MSEVESAWLCTMIPFCVSPAAFPNLICRPGHTESGTLCQRHGLLVEKPCYRHTELGSGCRRHDFRLPKPCLRHNAFREPRVPGGVSSGQTSAPHYDIGVLIVQKSPLANAVASFTRYIYNKL